MGFVVRYAQLQGEAMSVEKKLGPWPLGIDNVSDEARLKRDQFGNTIALRDAFNVDVDRDGRVSRCKGSSLAVNLAGAHSLWTGWMGSFAVANGTLYQVNASGASQLAVLNSDDPCDYCELNDAVIVSNRTTLIQVKNGAWQKLGVPNAPAPFLSINVAGSLPAGRYSVAMGYLRGDEQGALSQIQTATLATGQGITVTLPPADPEATAIALYRTEAGGTVLYRCAIVPVGAPSFVIGNDPLSTDAATLFLTRMLPGEFVSHWRGRLLVARGRTLYWSEPMRYGLTSLRHNFVQLPFRITMVAGVRDGVFVGSSSGVGFLRGDKPKEWVLINTSGHAPVKRCVKMLDGEDIDPQLNLGGQQCALWLADNGFVIGTPTGQIIAPQANRLRIPLALSGSLAINDRRATAVLS